MATVITPIIMKAIQYCDGDVIIKFMNDYGGFSSVLFYGNGRRNFDAKINEVSRRRVTDFENATGREDVIKITSGESLEFSRQFPATEKEGLEQMLSSRLVQAYYSGKWYDVQLGLKDWKDRVRDNAIMIVIKIKLPERFINE